MVLHLCRFPFRYLHEALQLVRCHYKLVQHHGSEFSLDLRARYSAMLVSKLLRVVRKIVVLCWFHLSAQVEVENFVSEIFKNELFASVPVHQFLEMSSHSLTTFAVNRNQKNHHRVPNRNLVFLCTRSLHHCTKLCAPQHVFRSEIESNRFHRNLEIAKVYHQDTLSNGCSIIPSSSCSFWTEVQWKFDYCSSCVKIHSRQSTRLGLLTAPRSKLPCESELAELSYV